MHPSQYTPEGLFEPRILELYKHAKAFVIARFADTGLGKELESPSDFDTIQCHKNFESRNLEKRCSFRRKTGFQVDIDFERIKSRAGFIKVLSDPTDYVIPAEQGRILENKLGAFLVEKAVLEILEDCEIR